MIDRAAPRERSGELRVAGLRLRYWTCGEGPPLVVLHGQGGNLHMATAPSCGFRPLADRYTIVAYEQRGCGDSARVPVVGLHPPRDALRLERHVEDLEAVVDALGIARFSLCGVSYSAAIAAEFAARSPGRVERLICINGGPVPMTYEPVLARVRDPELYHRRVGELAEGLRRWNQFTIDAFYQFEIARHTFAAAMKPQHYDDALALGLSGRWVDVPNGLFGFWMQRFANDHAASFDREATRARLGGITAPTLITWGRFDPHPLENLRYLADAVRDARLVVFEESGHFPNLEETERFTALVRAFLGGQPLPMPEQG